MSRKQQKCSIEPPSILPPVSRIICIGDLHGDYKAAILALRKAKVINNRNRWIGGDTHVVQLGDQLDRGGRLNGHSDEMSELKLLDLFEKLHEQAEAEGGAVYSLLGNHELMNVFGNMTYVSPQGLNEFGGVNGRKDAFTPGGVLATRLACTRNAIMQIGNWTFVHGGLIPKYAKKYSLKKINEIIRKFLLGNSAIAGTRAFQELFMDSQGVLHTRDYSRDDKLDCDALYKTLAILEVDGMVVAHTVQRDGINSKCNSKVYRIDTGMSEAFGKREDNNSNSNSNSNNRIDRIQVLEILHNKRTKTDKVNILV
jgi:hypothetical protein